VLGAASINSTGTYIAFHFTKSIKIPGSLYQFINNYSPVKITNINAGMQDKPLPKTEVIKWKGADGKEIEGLLTYPINYKPGTKVPFILNVHGGPAGVFQQTCVAG
jgi:dipeptidyl aminopeptidase/acylaminoacyl peptidase